VLELEVPEDPGELAATVGQLAGLVRHDLCIVGRVIGRLDNVDLRLLVVLAEIDVGIDLKSVNVDVFVEAEHLLLQEVLEFFFEFLLLLVVCIG